MQGVEHHITDPAVHSKQKSYGAGDHGTIGKISELRQYVRTTHIFDIFASIAEFQQDTRVEDIRIHEHIKK